MKLVVPTTSFPCCRGDFSGHFILSLLRAECAMRQSLVPVVVTPAAGEGETLPDLPERLSLQRFRYLPKSIRQTLVSGGIMPNLRANPLRGWQVPLLLHAFRRCTVRAARDAQLVHAHWSVSGFCAAPATKHGVPMIVTLHGSDFSGAGGIMVDALTRYVVRRADGVICVNNRLRERVEAAGVRPERVVTIRNGIDVDRFCPRRDRSVLTRLGIPAKGEVILFIGRLADVKGPDRALDVFERFVKRHPQACLIVVGDGPCRSALTKRVATSAELSGCVHWAGVQSTDTIPGFFAAADALLISSRNEGLPTVVLESLAAGVPIVTVPVGGIPEIVKDGETGYCALANTTQALADALEKCFVDTDVRQAIVGRGRELVVRELSWSTVARKHLEFYDQVIERSIGQ